MSNDIVLINGNVLTMSPVQPRASAVAIRNGRVIEVGNDDDCKDAAGQAAVVIDLNGRTATPGLNDAHAHPMGLGFALSDLDVATPPCDSIDDIVELVRKRTQTRPAGQWIVGRGYDQGRIRDRRHPTRHDLDAISPYHPVLLIRACHHISVANSLALSAAGIDRNTPNPEGGTIDRDEHGEPTGVLRENAFGKVQEAIGAPTEDQIAEAVVRGGNAFLATGVTSAVEAVVRRPEELRAYQRLRDEDRLPIRSYLMMIIDDTLDQMIDLGIRTGFGDDRLRIGPAKLFSDGSIGGHTARMRQPYSGTDDAFGLWMQEPQVMRERIKQAHKAGFQVGVHAIGDAAIDLILDAYEEAQSEHPRSDTRHRIEHCSIVDEPQIERIARLGVVPIPGTSFLYYFRNSYVQNLGMDRLRYAYGMATFQKHGVIAAASTDTPVVPASATIGLQTMMTRRDMNGDTVWPEESIDLHDALRAYTVNGAYASFEETIKGTLAPGMMGDVTVFETDLESISPEEVGSVRIDHTILEGSLVYTRDGA
jgi:predicted amidohydrolase YtcJ